MAGMLYLLRTWQPVEQDEVLPTKYAVSIRMAKPLLKVMLFTRPNAGACKAFGQLLTTPNLCELSVAFLLLIQTCRSEKEV